MVDEKECQKIDAIDLEILKANSKDIEILKEILQCRQKADKFVKRVDKQINAFGRAFERAVEEQRKYLMDKSCVKCKRIQCEKDFLTRKAKLEDCCFSVSLIKILKLVFRGVVTRYEKTNANKRIFELLRQFSVDISALEKILESPDKRVSYTS